MKKALDNLIYLIVILVAAIFSKLVGIYMILQAISLACHEDIVSWQSVLMAFAGVIFYSVELSSGKKTN